jgi:hypothetical protein
MAAFPTSANAKTTCARQDGRHRRRLLPRRQTLKEALTAYSAEDIDGPLQSFAAEIPKPRDRHAGSWMAAWDRLVLQVAEHDRLPNSDPRRPGITSDRCAQIGEQPV